MAVIKTLKTILGRVYAATAGLVTSADMDASGVTAGSYTTANITVDAAGRVTAATDGSSGATYTADETTLHLDGTTFGIKVGYLSAVATSGAASDLSGLAGTYAPLASPTFTGTPTAPTATGGTNTDQLATTAFVQAAISSIPAGGVTSFNSRTGAVTLSSSDVTTALGYTPTNPTSLATVATSGAASDLTGLKWLAPVRVATTAEGTFASSFAAGQVVDGVTLAAGDRLLIKNQLSNGTYDGIYDVQATGSPIRAVDSNTGDKILGSVVRVLEGTTNSNTIWGAASQVAPTIGTDIIDYFLAGGRGLLVARSNLYDIDNPALARTNLGVPAGSGTSTGTNTGDQTITLTGDVTGSGTGTFATTIGAGKVTNAMLAGGIDLTAKVAGVLPPSSGGTGINNGSRTLTVSGNSGTIGFSWSGTALTVDGSASIIGTNTGDQTTITGNAGTATRLQTARTINGVSFDGSANITVPAAGSTLTDTVPIANGGTGATTAATARTNLGLGTAATQAATAFLQASNNLSDLGSVATARTNLGVPAGSGTSTGTNTGDQTAGTGLTLSGGAFSVNTTQSLTKLSNLTTNGLIRTTSGDGTLSVDTSAYLTGNQTITLSGDMSGSGTTAIMASIGAGKVTNTMLAGGIDLTAKVSGTLPAANLPVATTSQQATGTSTTVLTTPGTQAAHPSAAKAWAYITVSGGVGTIAAGYGVSSVTRNALGVWTVTVSTAFADANYTRIALADNLSGSGNLTVCVGGKNTTQTQFLFTLGVGTLADPSGFYVAFFGGQ